MLDLLIELGGLDAEDVIDFEAPEPVRREATSLYELMLVHGADPEAARRRIVELYSPPRVTRQLPRVRSLHLAAGSTFDLIADSEGRAWNFLLVADRQRALQQIARERPYLVIGSPPCTSFSHLQNLSRHRQDPATYARKQAEGKVLLGFAAQVYREQLLPA